MKDMSNKQLIAAVFGVGACLAVVAVFVEALVFELPARKAAQSQALQDESDYYNRYVANRPDISTLPGFPAPAVRFIEEAESKIAVKCADEAAMSVTLIERPHFRKVPRDKVIEDLKAKFYPEPIPETMLHIADLVYGEQYKYSHDTLSNYSYQWCDYNQHTADKRPKDLKDALSRN